MSWREQLRAASFRGVAFNYRGGDLGGGRRVVNHEYPMRDENYAEDLGRKARTISLTAVIAGDDYMTLRDQLLEALETAGPGALVHPYHGTVQVLCESYSCREESNRGGLAEISISFVPFGANQYPQAATSASTAATTTAVSTQGTVTSVFTTLYGVAGLPGWATAEASDELQAVFEFIETVADVTGSSIEAMAEFLDLVAEVMGTVAAIIEDPTAVAAAIAETVAAAVVAGGVDAALELVSSDDPPWGLELTVYAATTATRIAQIANQTALVTLVKATAITEAVKAAVDADYDSYDAAKATRDDLVGAIDELRAEAGDSGDDDTYLAMGTLKSSVVSAFRDIANLPYIRSVDVPAAVKPSLVLAYELYGDIERAEEIQTRNGLSHPGFLPQGAALEALSA